MNEEENGVPVNCSYKVVDHSLPDQDNYYYNTNNYYTGIFGAEVLPLDVIFTLENAFGKYGAGIRGLEDCTIQTAAIITFENGSMKIDSELYNTELPLKQEISLSPSYQKYENLNIRDLYYYIHGDNPLQSNNFRKDNLDLLIHNLNKLSQVEPLKKYKTTQKSQDNIAIRLEKGDKMVGYYTFDETCFFMVANTPSEKTMIDIKSPGYEFAIFREKSNPEGIYTYASSNYECIEANQIILDNQEYNPSENFNQSPEHHKFNLDANMTVNGNNQASEQEVIEYLSQ